MKYLSSQFWKPHLLPFFSAAFRGPIYAQNFAERLRPGVPRQTRDSIGRSNDRRSDYHRMGANCTHDRGYEKPPGGENRIFSFSDMAIAPLDRTDRDATRVPEGYAQRSEARRRRLLVVLTESRSSQRMLFRPPTDGRKRCRSRPRRILCNGVLSMNLMKFIGAFGTLLDTRSARLNPDTVFQFERL